MFHLRPVLLVTLFALPTLAFAARPERIGRVEGDLTSLAVASGQRIILADRTGGKKDLGRILELRNGRTTTLHSFRGYDGASPSNLLSVHRKVYGITSSGGRSNRGVLYELTRSRLRILHHFSEEQGYPTSLKADRREVYGASQLGIYIVKGNRLEFRAAFLPTDVCKIGGSYYSALSYRSGIWRIERDGKNVELPADDPSSWGTDVLWTSKQREILAVSINRGPFAQGTIRIWNPATATVRQIFDFQSFNGGSPRAAVLSPKNTLYTANAAGVWRIGKRPKKISPLAATTLHFAGRNLYLIRPQFFEDDEIWLIRNAR